MVRKRTQRDSLLAGVRRAMESLPPGRAIVFAGREGVERIASSLVESGLCDARRLKDAHRDSSGRSRTEKEEEVDDKPDQLIQNADKPEELEDGVTPATDWSSTAVYVGRALRARARSRGQLCLHAVTAGEQRDLCALEDARGGMASTESQSRSSHISRHHA